MWVRILDRFWGHSGWLLGALWEPFGHLGGTLGPLWQPWGGLGGALGAIWASLLGGFGIPWRFGLENRARAPKSDTF